MPDRIRFTLVRDGHDVRHHDFDGDRVQIGSDPARGDTLRLDLPQTHRHVRAVVSLRRGRAELEVRAGPIWLQGDRLAEGDVAELSHGDVLVFGTRSAEGPRLRFTAADDRPQLDDAVAPPRPPPAPTAAFTFEIDEDAASSFRDRVRKRLRMWYRAFASFRARAARLRYWWDLLRRLRGRITRAIATALVLVGTATAFAHQVRERLAAVEARDIARAVAERSTQEARQSDAAAAELQSLLDQCGCQSDRIAPASPEAIEALAQRFGGDPTFLATAAVMAPDKRPLSYASLLTRPMNLHLQDRTNLPMVMDRICSAASQKDRMDLVIDEQIRHGLHESYAFVPFVESHWCELAVSPTGPRGLMQFTRATAEAAFAVLQPPQGAVPHYDFDAHLRWLEDYASRKGRRGVFGLLAECSALTVADYRRAFYPGPADPAFPDRIDPKDPRTDPYASIRAAFAWLAQLDEGFEQRGFREIDRILFTMWAYNQGEAEVHKALERARTTFSVRHPAAVTFPMAYAAAMALADETDDAETARRIREGMDYGPRVLGAYLATAPLLDERQCR